MQSQKPGHGEFFRAKILDKLKKCVKIKKLEDISSIDYQ